MSGNRGPWLSSATALFFIWVVLGFLVRVWVKLRSSNWGWDDSTISAGCLAALMHVAATFWAIHWGYGLPLASIPQPHQAQVEKALYATQFFYIVSIGLSRVSTALFIGRLTRYGPQVRVSHVLAAVSGVWTIASVFVVALRGNLLQPWATLDGSAALYDRWIAIEVTGLVVELALWGLSIHLVWGLQMTLQKRLIILGAFGCRLLLIPLVAVRLFYLSPSQNPDPTFTSILASILTEAVLDFCLISASLTSLRPFLRPFHSGYIVDSVGAPGSGLRSGIRTRSHDVYYTLSAVKATNDDGAGPTIKTIRRLPLGSKASPHGITHPEPVKPNLPHSFNPDLGEQQVVISAQGRQCSTKGRQDDIESVDSAGSDQMIIRKTRDWSIRYEVDHQPQRDASHPAPHE